MVACAAGVNLHHQAIVKAHPRHLCQHLGAEEFSLLGIGTAGEDMTKEFRRLDSRKIGGFRCGMAVVGCGTTQLQEASAG